MTSNRVGGSSPTDPNKEPNRTQEQHRKIEKVEKVRAIDEAENERTRNKFKSFMEDDEEPKTSKREPSPLETEFYSAQKRQSSKESLFGASFQPPSSPPDITEIPSSEDAPEDSPPLPQSHDFWSSVDSPPDQPLEPHRFRETEDSASKAHSSLSTEKKEGKHKRKEEEILAKGKEKDSLYGPPGKTASAKEAFLKEREKEKPLALAKEKEQKEKNPPAAIQGPAAPLSLKEEEEEKKRIKSEKEEHKKLKEALFPTPTSKKDLQTAHQKEFDLRKEQDEKENKKQTIAIEAPSLTTLPNHIIPIAESATVAATPYISPQTVPLFYQMVGTIYVMSATPGVSKTEILLNSPAFANSKFFGSTISIEKYASAPDSLNIRLTGPNEAVRVFNQNIPNLYAAFQNGNFNFRIGRITAEYSAEKPVFRRKESGEGRGDSGSGDFKDRRGNR